MNQSLFSVRLVLVQTLKNDSIGTLSEHLDLAIGTANDRRHPLTRRVELTDIQNLILVVSAADTDEYRFGLPCLSTG